MSHAFADIAFTPAVKAAQERDGSRAGYARSFEGDGETFNDRLGDSEREFIAAQRSFYMATVSETGWPHLLVDHVVNPHLDQLQLRNQRLDVAGRQRGEQAYLTRTALPQHA